MDPLFALIHQYLLMIFDARQMTKKYRHRHLPDDAAEDGIVIVGVEAELPVVPVCLGPVILLPGGRSVISNAISLSVDATNIHTLTSPTR